MNAPAATSTTPHPAVPLPAVPLPEHTDAITLAGRHAAVFLDAYGVLVDGHGALPGAPALIARFHDARVNYLVLTNDASRLPETHGRRFAGFGMPIPPERVVSSGDLIAPCFAARGLAGARCMVLGPADSRTYVERAGGEVIPLDPALVPDAVVICDDAGFPFLEAAEAVLSALIRAVDAGRLPALVLPNPDLVYPKREGQYGFTAGALALMLEAALALRYPAAPGLRFERLGKPHAPIFAEACRRAGTRDAVMIGDQVATDIVGARDFGLPSALVGTGLARLDEVLRGPVWPTYLLPTLVA